MVKDIYERICSNTEVRANLIALKKEIGQESGKRALAYLLGGDYSGLIELLENEDPKVRKNAALILGEMEDEELVAPLLSSYMREMKRFVKASYLKALDNYDCKEILVELKQRLRELEKEEPSREEEKHRMQELDMLRKIIIRYEAPEKHRFCGYREEVEIILLTNRRYREITREQLPEEKVKMLAGGIRLTTCELDKILPIRTYREILFPIRGTGLLPSDPDQAAVLLGKSELLSFLERLHKGAAPFYYRVELKSRMPLDKKSLFIRKFTGRLEQVVNQKLINMPGHYEIELRLVENREGSFIPLLKLYTLEDGRFSYRRNALSGSIAPENAALFMELAKEYLTEGAQVLDPFCGVGTMLIERSFCKKASPLYGTDIYEEAIQGGRENAELAGKLLHFIHRDFFDFHHEYLFDEVISNLPGIAGTKGRGEIEMIYRRFLKKIPEHLKEGGLLLLYTTEPELLRKSLSEHGGYFVLKEWVISDRGQSTLFALRHGRRQTI